MPLEFSASFRARNTSGRKSADEALTLALATGARVEAAAQAAGVSPRTVYRRLADADFRREVARLRGDMVARAAGRLADGAAEAADALRALLTAEADGTRLRAAVALLDTACKLRDATDVEERLLALEEELAKRDTP